MKLSKTIASIVLFSLTSVASFYSSAQNASEPPEAIVVINNLWDMKQSFFMTYDYCIKTHKASESANDLAKEKWLEDNELEFSGIDDLFEKFLTLRLQYGGVDDKSKNVDSLLNEYNQGVEQRVKTLFSSFGEQQAGEFCNLLPSRINESTGQLNALLSSKKALLESTFQ